MRLLADKAYWIYSAGAMASIALAVFLFPHVHGSGATAVAPIFGPLSAAQITLILMIFTLGFGLFFVMPQLRQTRHEQAELTDRTAELEREVVTDPLTALYNRRYFEDALDEYLSEFLKIGAPLALLTLDLDHFKSVNDTYGHEAGDVVLKKLGGQLMQLVREHDIVARTGGEEFCIVAPFSREDQIRPFAERVCRMVSEMRVDVGAVILRPTISIGVASTAEGLATSKELKKVSDERLYLAKQQGRNRVCA